MKYFNTLLSLFLLISVVILAQTDFLSNGEFDSGQTNWSLYPSNGAAATATTDNGSVISGVNSSKISITAQGSNQQGWEIGYYQSISGGIVAGRQYRVVFQAKASIATTITHVIKQSNNPWAVLNSETINLTTSVQTYDFTFTASQTEASCTWQLQLGAAGICDVWIDDAHFYTLEKMKNNYFDNGLTDWETWGGANITAVVDATSQIEGTNSVKITVNDPGAASWQYSFVQSVTGGLVNGREYTLEYKARASAPITVEQKLQQVNDPWDTIVSGNLELTGTTVQQFSNTFTASATENCNWVFSVGALGTVELWIDDIHLIDPGPLPVELTSFTASAINGGVVLNWETATEVNNYGFDIEASTSSATEGFVNIGFVSGHGNSNSPNSYSFVATDGASYYRLKQIDTDGAFEYSDVVEVATNLSYKLNQNHPNPFNPSTTISYTLPKTSHVVITIYNALGQKVTELVNQTINAGNHNANFDASQFSSGMYFYQIQAGDFSKTMKMMLLK